jgi:hypothetical protein
VVKTTCSIDIICRHWAVPEKKKQTPNHPPLVALPSWVQEISESPFGKQEEGFNSRKNGDSFVGIPDRRCYNAFRGMTAEDAWFGADPTPVPPRTSAISQENGTENAPGSPGVQRKRDPSLYVKGLQLGTIAWASDPIPDDVIPMTYLQKGGWSELREHQVTKAPEKLWHTLVADRGADGGNPPGLYHRACLHCLVNDTPNGHINTRELLRESQPGIV